MHRELSSATSLERRLQALEASNRRYRLAALGALAIALLGCFGGTSTAAATTQASAGGVIEASAFLLRGPDGAVAARLDFAEGGPRLALYSEPEVVGALLRAEPRSSELRLDAKGKRRTHLEAQADLNVGRISLVEDSGKVMLQMLTESGASTYALYGGANPKGVRAMLNLLMPPVGPPVISLRDAELKTRVIALDE